MYKHFVIAFGLGVIGAAGWAPEARAQSTDASEMTAEQLEELFKKQKTRGLVLAPSAGATAATASATTTASNSGAQTYVALNPEEQVNIQIAFDFDSAALRHDQKPKLTTLCQVMQSVDIALFRIVGHTDASGSASYNEKLSLLRAQEVKRHLVSECGIAETRLEAVGVGEQFPLDQDDPSADANRRVEFQALS